jgi:hypothetical protein
MSKTPKLFSINDNKIITHKSEKEEHQYCDCWKEKENTIEYCSRRNGTAHSFTLHKAIDIIQKNEITKICENIGAEHYFCGSNNENYVLDYEKGNLFYEENEHGKIIFFNKDYYKFIPHKKHNYNPKTGMVSIDYFEFINKGIPHEQDAFVKAMFSFKGENVYANIFNEIALYRKSSKSKFQTANINSLIEIIL